MPSIPSLPMRHTMPRTGLSVPRLLIILALCLNIAFGAKNNTVDGVEMLSQSSKEKKDELILDQKLKEAFESAKRTLATYEDAKTKLLTLSNEIIEGKDKTNGIVSKMEAVEKMKEEVTEKTERVDERIREINSMQIKDLKEKVELLHKRELERRAMLEEKEEFLKRRDERKKKKQEKKQKKKEKLRKKKQKLKKQKEAFWLKQNHPMKKKTKQFIPKGAITRDELNEFVDVKALMDESDKRIEDFFVEIVEAEVDNLQGELEETVIEATTALQDIEQEEKEKKDSPATSSDCSGASLTDAVQMVQQSLVKFSHDKVGMVDHLARAHVVHHLTSKTFVPPSYSYQALDDLWWFEYLPEDWEKGLEAVLPDGWRKWNTAIPDYFYHTMGMYGPATTAPPEAILKPSLHPGSCWPMDGQAGQVTLRLPYPVKVTAVTLDHAPSLLFEDQTKRDSAPKNIRVFGFPPCWTKKPAVGGKKGDYRDDYLDDGDGDEDAEYYRGICDDGLDFDVSEPVVLHDFEYDLEGPSIQTFHIPLPDEDEGDAGSCTEDTGTCGGGLDGGPNDILFASPDRSDSINEGMSAIRLEVTDNWGNKDYTCIYRFRIHGDAMDPNDP